jgi:RNA-binding protein
MNSKQRAYLRGLANGIDSIFQVGKNGVSDNLINQLDDALEARELIKINVLENSDYDVKELGNILANDTNSILVQTVGNKITLFRQRKKDSKIVLPKE